MKKSQVICEVKSLDGADPNGSFEAILSAPTLDRDGEVIDARAFEPLPERIPIDIDHGMTVATTVGSGEPYYDGDVLKIRGTFSSIPRAQELRTLVTEGHVARMSVTFMDAERSTKDGVPHVTRAELLNAAFVPIPSNREAAVLVAKAFAPTAEEVKATKADRLQTIHDLAVQNGAACDASKTPRRPATVKAHGMTANDLRDALERAVRAAHGADDRWTWVRDYADEWVVFEASADEELATYQQAYIVTNGAVALVGDPVPVVAHVTYAPVTAPQGSPEEETAAAAAPAAAAAAPPPAPALSLLAVTRAQAEAASVL